MDSNGNTLSTSTFDSFGSRVTNDTSGDPFGGFAGQFGYRNDSETGLQLLGMRYYDTNGGRFIIRDPIGYSGGINVYNYVGNSPTILSDPEGLAGLVTTTPRWIPGVPWLGPPHHKFIRFDKPCSINGMPVTSIGLYPAQSIAGPLAGITRPTFPDPIYHDKAFHPKDFSDDVTDNSAAFEAALCKCVNDQYKHKTYFGAFPGPGATPSGKGYPITPYVCYNYAWDMWDCARHAVPLPPRPYHH